jgi:putative ABC transport system substrate-binding protein
VLLRALAVALAGICGAAQAQPARIAYLSGASGDTQHLAAFRQGMRELGHVEGKSFLIEARFAAGNMTQLPRLASELLRGQPALFVAYGQDAALSLKSLTRTVPIVVANAADPVGSGLVSSLARPGGNITGMSDFHGATITKRLELLKETLPELLRVGVFWRPSNTPQGSQVKELSNAGPRLGVSVMALKVDAPRDIEPAFAAAKAQGAGAVFLLGDALLTAHMQPIIDLSFKYRIPTMYTVKAFAEAGGMLSYGADINDLVRRSAGHVDKILKGARAGELPIEQSTKFELVVNLRSAKSMGIDIPRALLLRADHVIQ